jgi:hypothetical protein
MTPAETFKPGDRVVTLSGRIWWNDQSGTIIEKTIELGDDAAYRVKMDMGGVLEIWSVGLRRVK